MTSLLSRRRALAALGGGLAAPVVLGAATASAQSAAVLAAAARPAAQAFALGNGLRVIVLPSNRAPIVNQMLWYRVGAADEVPGKSGLAHFLEHLMFKGTPTTKPGEFTREVARHGGRDNAFTSYDYTGYWQTVAAERLNMVVRYEADRMVNLSLDEKELLPERDVVLEERRQVIESRPSSLLDEATREALFGRQPYGLPVIGFPQEIRTLGVDDAVAFYRRWYAPNNAVLIVSGDVKVDAVRALVEKHYGSAPRRAIPARTRPDNPAADLPRRVVRQDQRVTVPSWSRDWIAPSYRKGETRHAYALQVLAQAFGGGQTGRLHRRLVLDRRIALDASAGYSAQALGLSTFGVFVTPAPLRSIAEIEGAMREEVERALQDGFSLDEIERARTRLLSAAIYARDSLTSGARQYGAALSTGGDIAEVEAWPARIAEIGGGDVLAAARAVLAGDRHVTSVLLPGEASK